MSTEMFQRTKMTLSVLILAFIVIGLSSCGGGGSSEVSNNPINTQQTGWLDGYVYVQLVGGARYALASPSRCIPLQDATVTVGELTATTNATGYYVFYYVPEGTHTVTITKDGFSTITRSVKVEAEKKTTVSPEGSEEGIIVPVSVGSLSITSNPASATIIIDSYQTDMVTPGVLDRIPAGEHTVSVSLYGYMESATQSVNVVADETEVLSFSLNPIPVCGNAAIETGEACDDGNTMSQDGCSASCLLEEEYIPPKALTLSLYGGITCGFLELTWSPSLETDFAKYTLYMSETPNVDQSDTLVYTISDLVRTSMKVKDLIQNRTYYFRLFQCDTADLCTGSNELNVTMTPSGFFENEWITIPAGEFIMGCTQDHDSCSDYELPAHTVMLDEYQIQKFEITNRQYRQCVSGGGCLSPNLYESRTRSKYYDDFNFNDYPVIYIDWEKADTYCQWIGARLPTEAEWEKAAKGASPSQSLYPWGTQTPEMYRANYGGINSFIGDTTPVGCFPEGKSVYGLMDMSGNVSEWVSDWYDANYYSTSPGVNPTGPESGTYKVMRGNSWANGLDSNRVTVRIMPNIIFGDHNGFRCAKD